MFALSRHFEYVGVRGGDIRWGPTLHILARSRLPTQTGLARLVIVNRAVRF